MNQDRFGFEWEKYNSIKPEYHDPYRKQFLNWTHPLQTSFYNGKKILDAGCGMGRNSYWCLEWGASEVYAVDHDERSVQAAKKTLQKFSNVKFFVQDLEQLSWENEFDFIFSIGVIHHTKNPDKVMRGLHRALKPGGGILVWVYSRVGFESIIKILDPIRITITSKMNLTILHWLTYLVSAPLYLFIQSGIPRKPYYLQMKSFSFSHMHSIIFDQMLPPIARYYSKEEAQNLAALFRNVEVYTPPNKNGWIVRAAK